MKSALTTYEFNAANRTINFSGVAGFDIKRLIAITHDPTGKDLYSLDGYASFSGTTLTLKPTVDTAGMSNSDPLTILYEFPEGATEATAVNIYDKLSSDPATGANQDEQTVVLSSIDTKLGNPLSVVVNGAVEIANDSGNPLPVSVNFPETQPVSISGPIEITNDVGNAIPVSSVDLGTRADTAATTDTGTFSLIAFVKRLLSKTPSLGAGTIAQSSPVNIASDQTVPVSSVDLGAKADTAATSDTGSFSQISLIKRLLSKTPVLGAANSANSSPVVLATDQPRINVSTEERPTSSAAAITPSDTVNLASPTRGVYVGVAGNIAAVINGTAITFSNVPAGMILPIVATRINLTGTSASSLVALF